MLSFDSSASLPAAFAYEYVGPVRSATISGPAGRHPVLSQSARSHHISLRLFWNLDCNGRPPKSTPTIS